MKTYKCQFCKQEIFKAVIDGDIKICEFLVYYSPFQSGSYQTHKCRFAPTKAIINKLKSLTNENNKCNIYRS